MRSTILATFVLVLSFASTLRAADVPQTLPASGSEEKIPTIKEIMRDAHRCRTNYIGMVRKGLQQEQIPWDEVGQKSHELVKMGHYLQKNTPPNGTSDEWNKITGIYISHATLLADAADRKDSETAVRHQTKLQQMCVTCHRAHR